METTCFRFFPPRGYVLRAVLTYTHLAKIKPVTREAINIISQQWQQSADSKQCLIVVGEHPGIL